MNLELVYAQDLTPSEAKALTRLSFRENGSLMYELDEVRRYCQDKNARVIRVTDDDGKIVSWGLMRKLWYRETGEWDLMLYTRSSERKKGYGKMIYQKAMQVAHGRDKLQVHPHDLRSNSFFDSVHFDESGAVRKSKKRNK